MRWDRDKWGTNRGQQEMHLSTPKRWTDGWGVYVYTPSVPLWICRSF